MRCQRSVDHHVISLSISDVLSNNWKESRLWFFIHQMETNPASPDALHIKKEGNCVAVFLMPSHLAHTKNNTYNYSKHNMWIKRRFSVIIWQSSTFVGVPWFWPSCWDVPGSTVLSHLAHRTACGLAEKFTKTIDQWNDTVKLQTRLKSKEQQLKCALCLIKVVPRSTCPSDKICSLLQHLSRLYKRASNCQLLSVPEL